MSGAFEFGYNQVHDWWGLNNLLLASPSPLDEFRIGHSHPFLFSFLVLNFDMFFLLLIVSNVGFLLRLYRPCVSLSRYMRAQVPLSQSRRVRGSRTLDSTSRGTVLIQNFTDEADQMMRGNVPWRGPREKHQSFYQMLIEAFSREGDIIMDWQARTG